ncbi:alpha/beta fold hydrolase [Nocardia sp. CDC160]|uniref:alpha/beta fold hydrolase n=1 Tax=Nocardia sp. CDC160 TaxID=3112166 RepID=UPI002DB71FE4|nr:alpha/beta hydrolase [Nocardia sp. CDC160]MEC3914451.1 alpha/beta hydrolase [Nocardia sp. CDC160]
MVNPLAAMLRRPLERRRRARLLELVGPDAIREESFVSLGGIDQWVTIRGRDRSNPILLVLHGGPGSPYTPFNSWLGDWEREFTVVQWDQRGGGRTFIRADERAPDLSLDRLVADGLELSESLVARFGRRVLVLGSSVGSLIGAIMAKRRPELFTAFIAANVLAPDPEHEGFRLVYERADRRRDRRALQRIGPDSTRWSPEESLRFSKIALRASVGAPDMVYDLMLPALMYDPELSMSDIRAFDRGMTVSLHALQPEYESFDFDGLGYDYAVPVVIVQGAADLLSPPSVARRHFQRVQAPRKRFVEIEGAGHLVEFADRSRFLAELRTTDRVGQAFG